MKSDASMIPHQSRSPRILRSRIPSLSDPNDFLNMNNQHSQPVYASLTMSQQLVNPNNNHLPVSSDLKFKDGSSKLWHADERLIKGLPPLSKQAVESGNHNLRRRSRENYRSDLLYSNMDKSTNINNAINPSSCSGNLGSFGIPNFNKATNIPRTYIHTPNSSNNLGSRSHMGLDSFSTSNPNLSGRDTFSSSYSSINNLAETHSIAGIPNQSNTSNSHFGFDTQPSSRSSYLNPRPEHLRQFMHLPDDLSSIDRRYTNPFLNSSNSSRMQNFDQSINSGIYGPRTMINNSATNNSKKLKVCAKTEISAPNRSVNCYNSKSNIPMEIPVETVLIEKLANIDETHHNTRILKENRPYKDSKENIYQQSFSQYEIKNLKSRRGNNASMIPKMNIHVSENLKPKSLPFKENLAFNIEKNTDFQENYSPNFEESPRRANQIRVLKKTNHEENAMDDITNKIGNFASKNLESLQSKGKLLIEELGHMRTKSRVKKSIYMKKSITIGASNGNKLELHRLKDIGKHIFSGFRKSNNDKKRIEIRKKGEKNYCDYMTEDSIFQVWVDFLPIKELCIIPKVCKKFRSYGMMAIIKKAQCRLISKGLSETEQYQFWDLNVNFNSLQKTYPLQYAINSMKPSKYERDIMSDIDRTRYFGNNSGSHQEDSLLRILFALSNSVPKIGYVQGMNTMTAVFLATRLKESEIYWLIRYIFYKKKFDEVLHDGFPQVQVLNYQLEIYAKNYIPELVEHLDKKEIGISYFSTQWFITMFSYDLNLSHLIKIWNFFFVKGWKVIIRVALSLLFHFKNQICNKSGDELPEFLKSCIRDYISQIPEDELFKVAFSFKVSNRLLKNLNTLYQHSAPSNVILTSDKAHHLEWKILPEDFSPSESSASVQKDIIEYLNENIDQIKNINKLRGDAHKELDNYRSIQMELGTCSLVVDKNLKKSKNRLNMSTDLKSSLNSSVLKSKLQKSSENSFLQTLTDFGQKIKQILTPKEQALNASYSYKIPIAKSLSGQNPKEGSRLNYPPLSDRNTFSMSASISKRGSNHPTEQNVASRTSLVNVLDISRRKDSISSIQPFNVGLNKEEEYDLMSEGIITPMSTVDLFDKVEKDILRAPKRIQIHRKNTSMTQDLSQAFTKSQREHLDHSMRDRENYNGFEADSSNLMRSKKLNEGRRDERLKIKETNYQGGGVLERRNVNDSRDGRLNKEKLGEWLRFERSACQSENVGTINYSNLSTDIFDNKDSKKIQSKVGLDEFDLTDGLIQ